MEPQRGSPLDLALAAAVEDLRRQRRMSMRKLAKLSGVPLSQIQRVKQGQPALASTYDRLAVALGGRAILLRIAANYLEAVDKLHQRARGE